MLLCHTRRDVSLGSNLLNSNPNFRFPFLFREVFFLIHLGGATTYLEDSSLKGSLGAYFDLGFVEWTLFESWLYVEIHWSASP